jgi:hypothetical protein
MSLLKSKILLSVIVLASGGLTAVNAQIAAGSSVKGDIPIAFVVSGKLFDAGHYTISRVTPTDQSHDLLIRSDDGRSAIINTNATTEISTGAPETALTFENMNGQYYLSSMTFKGESRGIQVITGSKMRRLLAGVKSTPRTVVLTESEL